MDIPSFIQEYIALAPFSTFKIGGPARYFVSARDVDTLRAALAWAQSSHIPLFVLGGGSNILISDEGFDGLVIKIDFKEINMGSDGVLRVGAGVDVISLARDMTQKGWRGLEWAGGLPGTIGGALRGNAGAYRFDIGSQTLSVTVVRDGTVVEMTPEECEFAYRTSIFKTKRVHDIIVMADIKLSRGSAEEGQKQMDAWLAERHAHQPQFPSAGCIFQNYLVDEEKEFDRVDRIEPLPPAYRGYKKIPAAWLIEKSGLKGVREGNAEISPVHANFVVNTSHTRARDVWELMRQVKQAVYNTFGIELKEEVQLVGFDGAPPLAR